MNTAEKHKHKRGASDIYTDELQPFEILLTFVSGTIKGLRIDISKFGSKVTDNKSS